MTVKELSFIKRLLPLWCRPAARRVYSICVTPFNIIWYYFFHRKFTGDLNQRCLWEERNKKYLQSIPAVENDLYYQELYLHTAEKLKEFGTARYLEIGCYFGYRLNKFAHELPLAWFIGVDLGLDNLILGKNEILTARNVDIVNTNACNLPFRDNSIETVYTVTCLTHVDYGSIEKAIDEAIRVCSRHLLLVEVDHRPMDFRKKIGVLNWSYGYLHPYEEIIGQRMKPVSITPLYDEEHHPRFTMFHFEKTMAAQV